MAEGLKNKMVILLVLHGEFPLGGIERLWSRKTLKVELDCLEDSECW